MTTQDPPSLPAKDNVHSCFTFMVVAVGLLIVGIILIIPTFGLVPTRANMAKASSHAREIVRLLHAYAADHNGQYPDSLHPELATSNEAFRHLFIEELTKDERIFGCPASMFVPNGNIGIGPAYEEALAGGENHWAMMSGLTNKAEPKAALVFENPGFLGWPPRWDTGIAGQPKPGRSWSGGKIIIGHNDGSVQTYKLLPGVGLRPIAPDAESATPFDIPPNASPRRILQIQGSGTSSYTNESPASPKAGPP